MSIKKRLKKAVLYICITFFLLSVAFVYITFRWESQAGLIEVGCSAFLFIIFLHILKKIIPQYSNIMFTVLSVLIAAMLIYANYSLQKDKHREYTFKELLVGNLLVKKLTGKHEEIPEKILPEKFEDIIPGEFTRTKTEKYTIESSFEKPDKDLMGIPVILPLDKLSSAPISKERVHSLGIPKETVNYKLEFVNNEGLGLDRAKMVMEKFIVQINKFDEQIPGKHIQEPLYLPPEEKDIHDNLYRTIHDKPELPATESAEEIQPALSEETVVDGPGKKVMEKLQIP